MHCSKYTFRNKPKDGGKKNCFLACYNYLHKTKWIRLSNLIDFILPSVMRRNNHVRFSN